jgi:hypothetical protein
VIDWTGSCWRRCRKRRAPQKSLDRHKGFRCGHFLRSILALAETRDRTRKIFEREVQGKTYMPTTGGVIRSAAGNRRRAAYQPRGSMCGSRGSSGAIDRHSWTVIRGIRMA